MIDLNKTEKLLKEAQRKLEEHFSEQEIEGGLSKKVISKVKHYARLDNTPLVDAEDSEGETETPSCLRQLSSQMAVATVSIFSLHLPFK
jgi:hypothetical protein